MSDTMRQTKPTGFEYWGRRPSKGCIAPCKQNKRITHRRERDQFKKELRAELFTLNSELLT